MTAGGRLVPAALLAAALLAACAGMRRREEFRTEDTLVSAGFIPRAADTPERQALLARLPPLKLVKRQWQGRTIYAYADPQACHCAYIGGPDEYAAYRQLLVQRAEEGDVEDVAEMQEGDAGFDWGPWGPYGWQ